MTRYVVHIMYDDAHVRMNGSLGYDTKKEALADMESRIKNADMGLDTVEVWEYRDSGSLACSKRKDVQTRTRIATRTIERTYP